MGWVATVACALIATIFVYNWLHRDEQSSQKPPTSLFQQERELSSMQNGRVTRPGEDDSVRAQEKADQKEKSAPASSSQPVAIVLDTSYPENHDFEAHEGTNTPQINIQPQPEPQSTEASPSTKMATTSPSTLMPPPPLPSSKSSTITTKPQPTPRSQSPPRLKPPTIGRPPTAPQPRSGGALQPPPSTASTLRVPPTKVLSNTRMAPSPSPSLSTTTSPSTSTLNPRSKQVTLTPGHSPLDWAALTTNPSSLPHLLGKDATQLNKSPNSYSLLRITPSQLKRQNGRKGRDAWTVFQGKVYNLTPYVPFHPGGKGEILRGAGKDSVTLFMEVHPWVNWDGMLSECCVGVLVGEDEGGGVDVKNELDEMD